MHWWCRQYPVTDAAQEAKVTEATAVQIYQYFRDICSWKLLENAPLQLGGPGVIVQIDESLFRHKPKVNVFSLISSYIALLECNYRIIVAVHQLARSGSLGWWTPPIHQHLESC